MGKGLKGRALVILTFSSWTVFSVSVIASLGIYPLSDKIHRATSQSTIDKNPHDLNSLESFIAYIIDIDIQTLDERKKLGKEREYRDLAGETGGRLAQYQRYLNYFFLIFPPVIVILSFAKAKVNLWDRFGIVETAVADDVEVLDTMEKYIKHAEQLTIYGGDFDYISKSPSGKFMKEHNNG